MDSQEAQKTVVENIKARGYRDGWSNEQFLARNVAKLQEELKEFWDSGFICINMSSDIRWDVDSAIKQAGIIARRCFDDKSAWNEVQLKYDISDVKKELADLQVVLFNIADAIACITNEPCDVVEMAIEKSKVDIERGVR